MTISKKLGWLALSSLVALGSGCNRESSECSGDEVVVQVFNDTPLAEEITAYLEGSGCSGKAVVRPQQNAPTELLDDDLVAGDVVLFEVTGGPSVSCTVDQEGVDITYVRANLDFVGNLVCECGFTEYYDADPSQRGMCAIGDPS